LNKHLTISVLVFSLCSILLASCGEATPTHTPASVDTTGVVVAEGHVIPHADVRLTFEVRGQVAEILVVEGQEVAKGETLIRLAGREQAQAALTAANLALGIAQQEHDLFVRAEGLSGAQAQKAYHEAQIARAEAQLQWERIDPINLQDQIDDAQAAIRDTKDALDDAEETLAKYLDLKSDNPTRRNAETDVRNAEADYNEAVRKVEGLQRQLDAPRAALDAAIGAEAEAKRTYELSRDSLNPEQQGLLQGRLDNAKAQAAAAQEALNHYELKAPFAGVVTDVNTNVGELIGVEKYAVQVADFSAWYVETSDLTELEVVNIREGQQVEIEPDAIPGLVLKGVVESISQSYKLQGGDVLYTVRIKLEDGDPRLRWGMTVQTTFRP